MIWGYRNSLKAWQLWNMKKPHLNKGCEINISAEIIWNKIKTPRYSLFSHLCQNLVCWMISCVTKRKCRWKLSIVSSVRSSNSHPDLLLTHQHPLFQITPVLNKNMGLSLSEPSWDDLGTNLAKLGKILAYSGILWDTLAYSCILWHTLAYPGILWHTLV